MLLKWCYSDSSVETKVNPLLHSFCPFLSHTMTHKSTHLPRVESYRKKSFVFHLFCVLVTLHGRVITVFHAVILCRVIMAWGFGHSHRVKTHFSIHILFLSVCIWYAKDILKLNQTHRNCTLLFFFFTSSSQVEMSFSLLEICLLATAGERLCCAAAG